MAEPISIQQLKDASEDAITLADFIYKPANVMIPRRLAADINSLQYYLEYMSSYAQHSYETYDEMVANAVNLPSGVSVFVTNDSDTPKNGIYTYNGTSFVKGEYQPENAAKEFVEAKLGGLEVFNGKVRAQDVSTFDGSTQDIKNTEFRTELDALPFEGGVLADTLVTVTPNGTGAVARTQRDVNSDTISVKDFGAKGDGVTDDTLSIQTAINHLPANSTLDFVAGTYLLSAPLVCTGKKEVTFTSTGGAVIKNGTTRIQSYFDLDGTDGVTFSNLTFDQVKRNMPLYTPEDYASGEYNVAISSYSNAGRISIENCVFLDLYTRAVSVRETTLLQVKNCRFYSGVQAQTQKIEHISCQTVGSVDITNSIFDNAPITNPDFGVCGIVLSGITTRVNISSNYFNYCGRNNAGTHRLAVIDFYFDAANIIITDNRVDNTMGQFMRVSDVKNGMIRGNIVTMSPNCEAGYSALTVESGAFAGSYRACSNIKILDNTFIDFTGRAAYTVGVLSYDWGRPSFNISVSGNSFEGCKLPVVVSGAYFNVNITNNVMSSIGGAGYRGGIKYTPNPQMTSTHGLEVDAFYLGLVISGNKSQGSEMVGITLDFSVATTAYMGTIEITNNTLVNLNALETTGVFVDLTNVTNQSEGVVTINGNTLKKYNLAFRLNGIRFAELKDNHSTDALTSFLSGTGATHLSQSGNITLNGSKVGTATLVDGTVNVLADCRDGASVQLTRNSVGGTAGFLTVTGIVNGGFTINSSSPTDSSTVSWQVIY